MRDEEPDIAGVVFVVVAIVAMAAFAAWVLFELLPAWFALAWMSKG